MSAFEAASEIMSVIAFDNLDLWIPFLKVGWNIAKHSCNFILGMGIDDCIEHCAANIASGSCAEITVSWLDST